MVVDPEQSLDDDAEMSGRGSSIARGGAIFGLGGGCRAVWSGTETVCGLAIDLWGHSAMPCVMGMGGGN